VCVGVFTDIGKPCKNLISYFKKCNAAFLEANYDEEMLHNGNYPFHLKRRISGGSGHLSNKEALQIFLTHKPEFMSHLLLAHLSKNNNSPELVQQMFQSHAGNVKIAVASRYGETEVFQILSKQTRPVDKPIKSSRKPVPTQLSFTFA
jgi:phosphoribosyl 1,2-cyclic phosphodiesterase